MLLESGVNESEWAVYDFNSGLKGPGSVNVQLTGPVTGQVWAAVANFTTGHWSFNGPFSATFTLPLDAAADRDANGNEAVALLVTGGSSATVSFVALQAVNHPPVVSLETQDPTTGQLPLVVNFTAQATDPDGTIVRYRWDFDGDGIADLTSTMANSTQHIYVTGGTFHPTVYVDDDNGDTGSASLDVTVHGWTIVNLAADAQPNSIALINGKPAVSFVKYEQTPGWQLCYAVSSSPSGAAASDWQVVNAIDMDHFADWMQSTLAQVNGAPAIAYVNDDDRNLKYAYAVTPNGASVTDWRTLTVDAWGNTVPYVSLAEVNGSPAIAYGGQLLGTLHYARAASDFGHNASDWNILTLDNTVHTGDYCSLAMVSGTPAIAYVDNTDTTLFYSRSTTATGSSLADWQKVTIDNWGNNLGFVSLTAAGGLPCIAYQARSGNQTSTLKFAYAANATGIGGNWESLVVDNTFDAGLGCSLAIIGDQVGISYDHGGGQEGQDPVFMLSRGSDPAFGWITTGPVSATAQGNATLLSNNGKPAICFQNDNGVSYAILQ